MMDNEINSIANIIENSLEYSNRRKKISKLFMIIGLQNLGKGRWLALRNRSVVSGFIIDGASNGSYISTFILPSFDRSDFITWALGDRVVDCSLDKDYKEECDFAISSYKKLLHNINSTEKLIDYLYHRPIQGNYPKWCKYICYLDLMDFDSAEKYLDDSVISDLHFTQLQKIDEVRAYVAARDAAGVSRVLQSWRKISEKIFGPFDQTFDAFRTQGDVESV